MPVQPGAAFCWMTTTVSPELTFSTTGTAPVDGAAQVDRGRGTLGPRSGHRPDRRRAGAAVAAGPAAGSTAGSPAPSAAPSAAPAAGSAPAQRRRGQAGGRGARVRFPTGTPRPRSAGTAKLAQLGQRGSGIERRFARIGGGEGIGALAPVPACRAMRAWRLSRPGGDERRRRGRHVLGRRGGHRRQAAGLGGLPAVSGAAGAGTVAGSGAVSGRVRRHRGRARRLRRPRPRARNTWPGTGHPSAGTISRNSMSAAVSRTRPRLT